MVAAVILKRTKIEISRQGLTDRYEIWHGGAIRHLWCVPQLEISVSKIQHGGRHFEKSKTRHISTSVSAISTKFGTVTQFGPRDRLVIGPIQNLRSKEIEDGGGRHPNNIKITISRQRFNRSAQHLAYNDAYWSSEPGVLSAKVRTPVSVCKFCVRKFLRTW